jgi:hypothetical protein
MCHCQAVRLGFIFVACTTVLSDDQLLGDEAVTHLKHLEQGWKEADSDFFYSANQGSRLVPYKWSLSLEVADGAERFLDPAHMDRLRYLSRPDAASNPDGLPVGFVKDPARGPKDQDWLGLTTPFKVFRTCCKLQRG